MTRNYLIGFRLGTLDALEHKDANPAYVDQVGEGYQDAYKSVKKGLQHAHADGIVYGYDRSVDTLIVRRNSAVKSLERSKG